MEEKVKQLLFSLLRIAIREDMQEAIEIHSINEEEWKSLYMLAHKHDVSALVAFGLEKLGGFKAVSNSVARKFKQEMMTAVYRYEKQNYDFQRITEALENGKISFIPLKGSVIRKYYPEPYLRTSCDIDILIAEKDINDAKNILLQELGCVEGKQNSHEYSVVTPSETHVELHYNLIEEAWAKSANKVLKNVWETAGYRCGYEFWLELSDEIFYFYHIAHMAKHFENGGCGIRSLVDLWILNTFVEHDKIQRECLLEKGGLLKFSNEMTKLAESWFESVLEDEITKQVEAYIVSGGIYGTMKNKVAVQQQQKGGKFRYVLSKMFVPYEYLKWQYPILQKRRWLTPFMQVCRWFRLIFCGCANRNIKELRYNQNISKEEAKQMKEFLRNIGL